MDVDTSKVMIENWPNNPWHKDWIPILIAVIALITSIVSLRCEQVQISPTLS